MLETTAAASALILVLILLRRIFLGNLKLRLQYAVWLLVALRLLVPVFLFESSFSVLNMAKLGRQAERFQGQLSVDDRNSDPVGNDPAAPGSTTQGNGAGGAPRSAAASLEEIFRAPWLAGMAAVGLWFTGQNLRLRKRLRKTRVPLAVPGCRLPVYLTRGVRSPCLFGLFRPAIYLTPDSVADEQGLIYILAHEETHFRHGDHLWAYLRCVCLAVHWFNPLVWWAAILSCRDCELACDEGALGRMGNGHRKAYGNTLIHMITGRTKPSDLLCGATTMTTGKTGIKERIHMIAKKPNMLLPTLLAAILLVGAVAGCTFTGAKNAEITPLTAGELQNFNGEAFFNGEYLNIRNQFLSSLYGAPEQIDLFQLFYCGSGVAETATEAEKAAVVAQNGWDMAPDCGCEKISRANMDAVLTQYMGLTLAETDKVNLDQFTYLERYDAYYHFHGDTNYRMNITFSDGERQGDLIRLFYNDRFFADGEKVLTLRQKEGGYLFVSNQKSDRAEG